MLKDVSPDERMKTLVLNEFCRSYGYIWKQQGSVAGRSSRYDDLNVVLIHRRGSNACRRRIHQLLPR